MKSLKNYQTEPELFEPAEYLQTRGRPGFFSVLKKTNNSVRQSSFELSQLPEIMRAADPTIDTWITQAVFNQNNRRAVNLRDVGLLFVDLDTYHCEGLAGKTPEEMTALLLIFCSQEEIPQPSIVLFSGRGLQSKWLLSEAILPVSLFEWNQVQLALVKLFEPFAADRAARDVSRVLRLEKTINTKSGEICRVTHVTGGVEACPARYDFQELRERLVPEIKVVPASPEKKPGRKPILALPRELNFRRLNWYRLYDLRDLWKIRGGVPEGYRELTLFWELNFLLRAEPGKVSDLWKEAESLAGQIAPGQRFYRNSDLSTLYQRAQAARQGKTFEFQGREYPAMYTPRNQTLIELFQITPEEEQGLRTIISKTEKNRRRREKRGEECRAAGGLPREKYLAKSMTKGRVKPWEAEGISRRTWYRLQKRE